MFSAVSSSFFVTPRTALRAKLIGDVAKLAAMAVGLDPGSFSATSFKRTTVTLAHTTGMSKRESSDSIGHQTISANQHYVAAVLNKDAGALLALDLLGISGYAADVAQCEFDAFIGPQAVKGRPKKGIHKSV